MVPLLALVLEGMAYMVTKLVPFLVGMFVLDIVLELGQEDMYSLVLYKPFPKDLLPTQAPYLTPGPGYTYPPGKVPPTKYPGEIPTLSPYTLLVTNLVGMVCTAIELVFLQDT
jgi:hypothetical protein